jgi:hypothetical protein
LPENRAHGGSEEEPDPDETGESPPARTELRHQEPPYVRQCGANHNDHSDAHQTETQILEGFSERNEGRSGADE